MTTTINDMYLNMHEKSGVLYSAKDQLASLTPALDHHFFKSSGSSEYNAARQALTQPTILGHFTALPHNERDIFHHCITVKNRGAWDIGLPESFAFALPMARAVTKDLLGLYGPMGFEQTEMRLMIQRSDIQPTKAGRDLAKHWHTHERESIKIDLTYVFSDELPTEFKTAAGNLHTEHYALTRFGREVIHRSSINDTGAVLRRNYGLFMAIPERQTTRQSITDNVALTNNPNHREIFMAVAENYLKESATRFTPLPAPRVLGEEIPEQVFAVA